MGNNTILVTGGLGFIGSHSVLELLNKGYKVVVIDNLYNAKAEVEEKILSLAPATASLKVYHYDLLDFEKIKEVFSNHKINAVIHFAAYKAVGESCKEPLKYYHNNILGVINLLMVMKEFKVKTFIQSSSATVYGNAPVPYSENETKPSKATSPYGQTKINIEYMLEDLSKSGDIRACLLRYFNPVGAHPSGVIGEELTSLNNIFPYMSAVYIGMKDELVIFGNDYPTKDGTNERDYLHVLDLARGHVLALNYMLKHEDVVFDVFNLGSGKPLSVIEIAELFNKYADRPIPYRFGPRRDGDLPSFYANPEKANKILNFKTVFGPKEMVKDTVNFLKKNYLNKK